MVNVHRLFSVIMVMAYSHSNEHRSILTPCVGNYELMLDICLALLHVLHKTATIVTVLLDSVVCLPYSWLNILVSSYNDLGVSHPISVKTGGM